MVAKKKPTNENVQIEELSQDAVWSVIEFSRALINGQYLNPLLIESRMRDINLHPLAATEDGLNKALLSPKESEDNLRGYSQSFEIQSMVYKKLISYLADMLSFDITYTSDAEPEDYGTPKYKKDLRAVETFLDKFDYKKELSIVVREMLRNDAYFGCYRDDLGNKIILQELSPDYCKITGRWEGGFLFSFNMYWFLLPGVDINMYPDFFKKKYKEIWESSNSPRGYKPSLPPEMRGGTSWVYWVDIPVNMGVCFKLTPELATRLPYFTPLFSDLILQGLMRNLQKNANMAAASKMIIGQVPMLNKDAKASVKDSIAISPDLLGKFMALVKGALSESIKVASAPLEDMQGISFDAEDGIYDSYLKTMLATSGINTNLIFTSGIKPNVLETQLSLNVDEQMMTALYDQFSVFMDYISRRYVKNFKFHFQFEGTDFFLNRQQRLDSVMKLFDQGIILPQKIAAAMGMKPHELRKHMEESTANNFMSMLTPPMLENQKTMADIQGKQQEKLADKTAENQIKISDKAAETQQKIAKTQPKAVAPVKVGEKPAPAGRPKKDVGQISEETATGQAGGQNIGRGGKVD